MELNKTIKYSLIVLVALVVGVPRGQVSDIQEVLRVSKVQGV